MRFKSFKKCIFLGHFVTKQIYKVYNHLTFVHASDPKLSTVYMME